MSPNRLLATLAATAVLAAAGATIASAAGDTGDRVQVRSPVDARSPVDSRPIPNDYDEDDYRPRPPANGGWGGGGGWGNGGGWGGGYGLPRIEAHITTSGDYGPPYAREARARERAIEAWRSRVAYQYGERFSHWRPAQDKYVNCDRYRAGYTCVASARPARGWGGWGGWRRWGWNASD